MVTDYGSPVTGQTPRASRPKPSIDELMTAYLAEIAPPAAMPRARGQARNRAAESLELLQHGLNGYGYQHLGRADSARWQAAFDAGDESAFCRIAGASVLLKYLDEFLGYYLIRKVAMPDDEVAATIEEVRAFVEWLYRRREITPAGARRALGRLASASVDLPAAERLSDLLYDLAKRGEDAVRARGGEAAFEEIVDDYLVIERVAPGRLWFLDGVGPVKVPEAASSVARPGWTVNLVLGRHGTTWEILEVGNVYPETLA